MSTRKTAAAAELNAVDLHHQDQQLQIAAHAIADDPPRSTLGSRIRLLDDLAERIVAIETGGSTRTHPHDQVSTGWIIEDQPQPLTLVRGVLHEWLAPPARSSDRPQANHSSCRNARSGASQSRSAWPAARSDGRWSPPLLILIHLARCALQADLEAGRAGRVLWIGRSIWPHHAAIDQSRFHHGNAANEEKIVHQTETTRRRDEQTKWTKDLERWRCRDVGFGNRIENLKSTNSSLRPLRLSGEFQTSADLLDRSLFIDPPNDALRWWAIDQALRCPAISAVVADARGMDMACSRRLQVAAESGRNAANGGALALLALAHEELKQLSASMTRWRITPQPSQVRLLPTWKVECLRCKGVQRRAGTDATALRFLLEWNRVTGCVSIPAELADRSSSPQAAPQQRIA